LAKAIGQLIVLYKNVTQVSWNWFTSHLDVFVKLTWKCNESFLNSILNLLCL
jgi:hypothetical protein